MATLVVIAPVLILMWFLAPLALPIWRWRNLDFDKLSKDFNVPVTELKTEYSVTLYYHPRTQTDPMPWQMLDLNPTWLSINDKHNDETGELIRCTLMSERDGTGPSKFFLGSGSYRDIFWKAKIWRLPPGSFGKNKFRPVVVYKAFELEKCDMTECEVLQSEMQNRGTRSWTNDDKDVDDGVITAP
jgi:hypothetical protein